MEETAASRKACDQCYRRKLKCTRRKPQCHRCELDQRACTYSFGKPPKRLQRGLERSRAEGGVSEVIGCSLRKQEPGGELLLQHSEMGMKDLFTPAVPPSQQNNVSPDSVLSPTDTWSPRQTSAEEPWYGMMGNVGEGDDQMRLLFRSLEAPYADHLAVSNDTTGGPLTPAPSSLGQTPSQPLQMRQPQGSFSPPSETTNASPRLCSTCEVSSIQALCKQMQVLQIASEDISWTKVLTSVDDVHNACERFIQCSGVHEKLVVVLLLTILGQANAQLLSLMERIGTSRSTNRVDIAENIEDAGCNSCFRKNLTRGNSDSIPEAPRRSSTEEESWAAEGPDVTSRISMVRKGHLRGVMLVAGFETHIKSYQTDWVQESGHEGSLKDMLRALKDVIDTSHL